MLRPKGCNDSQRVPRQTRVSQDDIRQARDRQRCSPTDEMTCVDYPICATPKIVMGETDHVMEFTILTSSNWTLDRTVALNLFQLPFREGLYRYKLNFLQCSVRIQYRQNFLFIKVVPF